jgi:hypothetical protein
MIARQFVLAAAALVGLLGFSASASAAPPVLPSQFASIVPSTLHDIFSHKDVPLQGGAVAVAPCPAGEGQVAAGGGDGVALASVTPTTDGTSAVATTTANPAGPGFQVDAVVTCAPAPQFNGSTYRTATQTHPGDVLWNASAVCPTGMIAFGGGGYFINSVGQPSRSFQLLTENTLTTDGSRWIVKAVDPEPSDTLFVYTRCAPRSSSIHFSVTAIGMTPQPGTNGYAASAYAPCRDGYVPISGGVVIETSSPAGSYIGYTVPVRNGQIGWFGYATSIDPNATMKVVALCGR